jgi:hypothetical protein
VERRTRIIRIWQRVHDRTQNKEDTMSQHEPEQGGTTGSDEPIGSGAAAGQTGAEGSRLRERLAALGDRLDRLASSPEVQEARRKLAQAGEYI